MISLLNPRVPSVAPTYVSEIELSAPIQSITVPPSPGRPYGTVRLLVRLHRQPFGYVSFSARSNQQIAPETIATNIWKALSEPLTACLDELGISAPESLPLEGFPPAEIAELPDRPLISVVVCTRNRPEGAASTVSGLQALHYEPFEVVVVDNASSDDSTMKMVSERFGDDSRIRYVRENKPGLSFARNRGLAEARGDIVAFTDDDVRVDAWWLDGILRGFRSHENVGCVTGLVPSAELTNAVQQYFDQRFTWGTHLKRRVYDLDTHRDDSVLYPYSAGIFGTGANFAFDRETILGAGGFDEALGAGAPTGGGEDLDAFIKVLRAGKLIVQEPSSIIWHVHRAELDQLNKQMFNYGVGLSAFIAKYLVNPRTSFAIVRRVVPGVMKIRSISAQERSKRVLPTRVLLTELLGMAYGPIAYLRGVLYRREVNRKAARGEYDSVI